MQLRFSFYLALLLVCPGIVNRGPAAESTVEPWGTFELALNGPTNGNPFVDVKLSARFTQGNAAVEANGFYDGTGIYRVRFMPQTQGEWHYALKSSSPELNGRTGEFTVTKPSPGNHGPVRAACTCHFACADGTPYEEPGTTCYVWELQTEAVQEETLPRNSDQPA